MRGVQPNPSRVSTSIPKKKQRVHSKDKYSIKYNIVDNRVLLCILQNEARTTVQELFHKLDISCSNGSFQGGHFIIYIQVALRVLLL